MVILVGFLGIFLVIVAVLVINQIRIGSQILKTVIHEPRTNDDLFAIRQFTTLLERAHSNMAVYDDGDKMEESIYMQQEVVEAIKKKLDTVPDFTLRCYFNDNAPDTLFRQTFDGHDRVDIRMRPDGDIRPNDTHYKIIDDGLMAYLSQHGHGIRERKFQVIDCTRVNPSKLQVVTNSLLGEYKQDIKQKFPPRLPS